MIQGDAIGWQTKSLMMSVIVVIMPYFNDAKVAEITPKMLSSYKAKRYGDGLNTATINRELSMLSKAFNLAVREWER